MPDPDRLLRQRSALAECALASMGAVDPASVGEAAVRALSDGLGMEHVAVLERKSYGLDLMAASGWPMDGRTLDPPQPALRALGTPRPVVFGETDEVGTGVAIRVETDPVRMLVATTRRTVPLAEPDLSFVSDTAAIFRGGLIRTATAQALRASEYRARTSEAHAHAIVNTTVDGILTLDAEGTIQSINPAAERIFGYRAAELLGHNVSALMPRTYAEPLLASLSGTASGMQGMNKGREVIGKRRDNTTFPMDLAMSEVVVPGLRLFTAIVRDITERRQLEREVVRAIEDERRILGQELHDELGQQLSGLRLVASELARRMQEAASPFGDEAQEIAELIRTADVKARSLSRGLVLMDVSGEPLDILLAQMTQSASRIFSIAGRFTRDGEPVELADITSTHLYRIAQEAFTNSARHASAQEIHIHLDWMLHGVRLVVSDDGIGVGNAPEVATESIHSNERRGMGIQTMRYRARLIGGTFEIGNVPAGGTRVTCTVPHQYAAPDDLALDLGALTPAPPPSDP